jgi:chemotaxis protein CheX
MSEETLQIFIDGVVRYFEHTTDKEVGIGTPYLASNKKPVCMGYTGVIGISGPIKGCIYFTAPSVLLKHLLLSIGETETGSEYMLDLVGEVANTLSGNARRELGKDFVISVPLVVEGSPTAMQLPKDLRSYVVPITWKSYTAAVVICLSR